jgi:predicted ATPase/DNA-binding CsgD family transcriptional regulator
MVSSSLSPGHLPAPLSPFIGRELEVDTVSALLCRPETRLVTLTGPGGVGKTRLALEAATAAADEFPGGAWFVSLSSIPDPALVGSTIAKVLDVREASDQSVLDRLRASLRNKRLLLVLDNFEHVVQAAPLVADLLAACPALTVLATSRMRLRVSGEREYAVAPLQVVELVEQGVDNLIRASDAVRLFVERGQAVDPSLALTLENAAAISEICTRLDGLPLAIELAAAWVKVLPPQALLARLERRLPLLTGGSRDLPARQRTMRDTIAWSHDLISSEEQALFRRLAIFAGGWTLEAAQAVAATSECSDTDLLQGIAALVDKSLINRDVGVHGETPPSTGGGLGGEPRFSMLETVREFGLEQLAAADETSCVADRHADFFLDLVERLAHAAFSFLWGQGVQADAETLDPMVANQQFEPEHGNVRVALDWLVECGRGEDCLRLTTACAPFWESYGRLREAQTQLDRALAVAGVEPTPVRAQALHMASNVAFSMGQLDVASGRAREALAIWQALEDERGQALALHSLALVEENNLNWQIATEMFEATLEIWRRLDEPVCVGTTLAMLGGIAYGQGQIGRAVTLEEEAFSLLHAARDFTFAAVAVWYLGLFAAARGELLEAARRYRSSLVALAEVDDAEWLFKPLVGLAGLAAQCQHFESSARLLGAVDRMLFRTGGHLFPFDRLAYEQAETAARAALGEERFAHVHGAGGNLAVDDLLTEADTVVAATEVAEEAARRLRGGAPGGLTGRELDVLRLMAVGKTDREIAEALFISRRTVNTHVANILSQLGVHSRHDAVARARELTLLPEAANAPRYT